MKAFTLLVLLVMIFFLIASSTLSTVDLTPDTPPAAAQSVVAAEQVINIQEPAPASAQPVVVDPVQVQIPVTGACSDPYIVRAGDTLGGIAAGCGTTVAVIRTSNPEITNANLIYPGQQIRLPGAPAAQQAVPLPVTGVSPTVAPQAAAPQTQVNPLPATGLGLPLIAAGTGMQVKAINFPPNTPVNVMVGPQNAGHSLAAVGVTDATGSMTTSITVPSAPDSVTAWDVIVTTTGTPPVQARSQGFTIQTP